MAFSRSRVEAQRDLVELSLTVDGQVEVFGQVRSKLLVFSLLPRYHGLCGSAKYTCTPVQPQGSTSGFNLRVRVHFLDSWLGWAPTAEKT